jgi:hypothetical protein
LHVPSADSDSSDSDEHPVRRPAARRTTTAARAPSSNVFTLNSDEEEFDEPLATTRTARPGRGRARGSSSSAPTSGTDNFPGHSIDEEGFAWPDLETCQANTKSADSQYFFGVHTVNSSKKCRICK